MKLYCIIALSLLLRPETATAQQEESITLSLQQAIEIAQENSPEAQAARHTYRAAYWNYRFFRANYLTVGIIFFHIIFMDKKSHKQIGAS